MEADQILESLANYIWFLRASNAVCISHLLLIDRRTLMDLWRHKFEILVTFNLEKKFIIFVNSIKGIRTGTFLELASETAIWNNLTAKVSVKCIKWFAICASVKLSDLMTLITYFTMCKIKEIFKCRVLKIRINRRFLRISLRILPVRDFRVNREVKHGVYGRRQTAKITSDFLSFSCNP